MKVTQPEFCKTLPCMQPKLCLIILLTIYCRHRFQWEERGKNVSLKTELLLGFGDSYDRVPLQGFRAACFPRSQCRTAVQYLSQIDSLFNFSLQDPDTLDQAAKQQLTTFMDGWCKTEIDSKVIPLLCLALGFACRKRQWATYTENRMYRESTIFWQCSEPIRKTTAWCCKSYFLILSL